VLTGLTAEKIRVLHQPKGYVDRDIFDDWLQDNFLVELQRRKTMHSYDGPAILLLDNCTAHQSEKFQALCQVYSVIACYLPRPSSNQVQPLDLSIFGITKKFFVKANRMEAMNVQTIHIARVVNAFMSAGKPTNIVKTFENSGICLALDENKIRVRIRPEKARCLLHPIIECIPLLETDEEGDDIDEMTYLEQCAERLCGAKDEEEDELE
jgi:hypothetical protein